MDSNPVYFSSSIFPIYKFNSLTNKVEEHYGPTIAWMSGFALAGVWAFLTTGSIMPEWFGVVLSIGIKLFILLSCIYLTQITKHSLASAITFVDSSTIKKAWLETKSTYY